MRRDFAVPAMPCRLAYFLALDLLGNAGTLMRAMLYLVSAHAFRCSRLRMRGPEVSQPFTRRASIVILSRTS